MVAARELHPGVRLSAADVSVSRAPGALVPDGALRLTADGIGRTVVSPPPPRRDPDRRPGAHPIAAPAVDRTRLRQTRAGAAADTSVGSILREGDVVDVLSPDSVVLARGAIVALTAGISRSAGPLAGSGTAGTDPAGDGRAVGPPGRGRGLDSALALVLH